MDRSQTSLLILILLSLAQLMIVLDFSIVNVALPSIQSQFQLVPTTLQWVVSAYALTFGGFLLFMGRASDLFGRKRVFLTGLAVFSVASSIGGFAPSAAVIFASRAAQGVGAAMLAPSALSLVTTTFAEGSERNWALGIFSSMAAIGFTTGVILGGILTSTLSWHWVFFVNVPIGVLVFVGGFLMIPVPPKNRQKGGFDVTGAALVTATVITVIYAITRITIPGEPYLEVAGLLILSVILGVSFLYVEQKVCIPLVPLDIFRRRTIFVADMVMFLTFAANAALVFIITLYLQEVRGFSAIVTGLIFLPAGIGGLTGAAVAPRIIGRIGFRNMLAIGLALFGVGVAGLSAISTSSSLVLLMLSYYVAALGLVSAVVSLNIAGTTGVESGRQGLAAGLLTTSQQIGAAIGVSVASVVAVTVVLSLGRSPATVVEGYRTAMLVSEGLIIIAIILALYLVRRNLLRERRSHGSWAPGSEGKG
jgi:EmrB/QacA subfamily drug resistance transporter